jgi:2-hydroxycyclohexanecarboxyl-CoA dehydrogenase
MRLEGRRALVTGGASGIGAAISRRLAAEAANVVIGDVNADGARQVATEIGGEAAVLDVADPDAAASVIGSHGPFEILINNAGTDDFAFFTEMTPERWRRLLAVNLEGVFACTHAVLPAMQEAGYGRIVNIASEAGRVGSKGSAAYSAAKGGVIAFTKTIARENGRYGITVNAIAPGPIDTPLLNAARSLGDIGERIIETMRQATQLRRLGTPEEVAAAVAFLASDDASYVTGETLGVSGGLGMAS